jgi:hypothetical protein
MSAMPYEWLLGTRYLRSTQRRGFLSFISIVSVLGLAVGVAVLIVVLSVMNGFERELRGRILAVHRMPPSWDCQARCQTGGPRRRWPANCRAWWPSCRMWKHAAMLARDARTAAP